MAEPNATPQPDGTPEPQGQSQPQQTQTPPVKQWYDSFQDDTLKGSETIKKYKTFDDFGKAFIEKDSLIGRKGIILPKEGNLQDQERFYNELGRPLKVEDYKVPEIKVEDNFKQFIKEEKFNQFKSIAHKYGLTQKQFEGVVREYTEGNLTDIKTIVAEENKKREESQKSLMSKWILDYDANSKLAENALKAFSAGVAEDKLELIASDPDLKLIFFNVAKQISEDKLMSGKTSENETVQTLQAFIDSQVGNSTSSYWDTSKDDNAAVKKKVAEAYALRDKLRGGA